MQRHWTGLFLLWPAEEKSITLIIPRAELHIHDAVKDLEKRVTDIDLETVRNGIPNKVSNGSCTPFTLDPKVAASYTTALFYGCTVVIIVDGKGVIMGHFAQETGTPGDPSISCASMTNTDVVDAQINPKLVNAELLVDGDQSTQAYIITPASKSSVGYRLISDNLHDHGVGPENIHYVYYPSGSAFQNFDGPVGKAVVIWVLNKGGGVLRSLTLDRDAEGQRTYDDIANEPAETTRSIHRAVIGRRFFRTREDFVGLGPRRPQSQRPGYASARMPCSHNTSHKRLRNR